MAVQVAADVVLGDQLGELAVGGGGDLAVALAQLGLDVGEAEALVDLLLGRVARDLARLGLEDPVLGDREALLHRPLAQVDVVGGRAGEVLEQVAVGVGLDDPQVDRDPVVGDDPRPGGAGGARLRGELVLGQRHGQRLRVARGRDQVDVLARLGAPPRRARRPRPGRRPGARAAPPRAPRRPAAPPRAAGAPPGPFSPSLASAASTFSSAFGPSPLSPRIRSLSAASRSSSRLEMPSSS